MKCPKCQSENVQEAKSCGKSGAKLSLVCTQCGLENNPGNNFCIECGHNLTLRGEAFPKELSFDEKIEKIQRYLPESLIEKILSQRDRIESERKQVALEDVPLYACIVKTKSRTTVPHKVMLEKTLSSLK